MQVFYNNEIEILNRKPITLLSIKIVTFLISAGYYLCFGNGLFFYQENNSLFIYSFEYLQKYLSQPGGLLVYLGNFLTQVYYYKIIGTLIISSFPVILISLLIKNIRFFSKNNSLLMLFSAITSCWLLILQTFYDHFIYHGLGLFFVLLWMNTLINIKKKYQLIFFLALFPVIYYIVGAFSLIYIVLYISFILKNNSKSLRFLFFVFILIASFVTFIIFKEFIFLQPKISLLSYPLPALNLSTFSVTFYTLFIFLTLTPSILKIADTFFDDKIKMSMKFAAFILAIFLTTFCVIISKFDKEQAEIMKIEKMVFKQNWDDVIKNLENFPSSNLIGQYYYNLALSEKGLLCDRLFHGNQDFEGNTLSLPHSQRYINRSYYFYYCIGLIKGANYLAFESMVLNGYQPENLKMLIKTEIINGNFKIAERFINVLKRTLNYRNWAKRYEKMIHNPSLIYNDSELVEKIKLMPQKDFFITTDDTYNISAILLGNQNNQKAFEYFIARMLLEKDYKAVVYQVKKMKDMGYKYFPRHIEEAILIYIDKGLELPYLGDLSLNDRTVKDFKKFKPIFVTDTNILSANHEKKDESQNTFWHYFCLENN